jgi:integrase
MLYETAINNNHWLKHPIWIAVHTGARQSAIANLTYNRDAQTISFPKAKKEAKDRTIPTHPDILPNIEAWVQNRKAPTTISNEFTLLKQSLGYGVEKDFHSFRRTLITEFENLECPENICADIVGHKKSTITYGLYSGGTNIDVMRNWLDKVKF